MKRGPGTASGVLGDESDKIEPSEMEGLQGRDLSNTLPGDLLQLQDDEHQIEEIEASIRQGGTVDDLGEGGELIWQVAPDLHPSEKRALQEFFR